MVLITYLDGSLKILLQKKTEEPFVGQWGLPGQLILPNEVTDEALISMMSRVIGESDFYFKQLQAFTELGRHPLGRVITVAYYGLIPAVKVSSLVGDELAWRNLDEVPALSYDHNSIIEVALRHFRKGLLRHPTVFELLPEQFIISDMIAIYEQALERKIDSPNFRKQVRKSPWINSIGEKLTDQEGKLGRKPHLHEFDKEAYRKEWQNRLSLKF